MIVLIPILTTEALYCQLHSTLQNAGNRLSITCLLIPSGQKVPLLLLILSSMGVAKQTVSGGAGQVNPCLMCSYGDDADGTGALDCPTLFVCIQVIYVHKGPSFVAVHTSYKPPTSACYSEHAYFNKSKTHLTLHSKAFVRKCSNCCCTCTTTALSINSATDSEALPAVSLTAM